MALLLFLCFRLQAAVDEMSDCPFREGIGRRFVRHSSIASSCDFLVTNGTRWSTFSALIQGLCHSCNKCTLVLVYIYMYLTPRATGAPSVRGSRSTSVSQKRE